MITHQIIVAKPVVHKIHKVVKGMDKRNSHGPNKSFPPFVGVAGSKEHRQYILNRSLFNNPFNVNDEVIYKRRKCIITDIYVDIQLVSWVGLSAKFIEIFDYVEGEIYTVNSGELKKVEK